MKRLGPVGSLLIGVVATVLAFVLMCYFNMFDALEVSITSLQLSLSSIALLVGALKARKNKSDSF